MAGSFEDSPTLRVQKTKHKIFLTLNAQFSAIPDALLPTLMRLVSKYADKRAVNFKTQISLKDQRIRSNVH